MWFLIASRHAPTAEPPRVLRPFRTAALLLAGSVLGAAATVAHAWWIAYHAPAFAPAGTPSHQGPATYRGAIVQFSAADADGVHRVRIFPWRGAALGLSLPPGSTLALHQEHLPRWSLAAPLDGDWRRDTPDELKGLIIIEDGYGWPCTTMVSRIAGAVMTPLDQRDLQGIEFTPPGSRATPMPSLLPTRPVWPAFSASTLIFSLPVTAPVVAGALVRIRRRRRGWCIACGYDAGAAAVCPECGAPRRPAGA